MNKKQIAALVKEAKSIGLDTIGTRDDNGDAILRFSSDDYPLHVAVAFAQKYDGRLIRKDEGQYIRISTVFMPWSIEVEAYHNARIAMEQAEYAVRMGAQPFFDRIDTASEQECRDFLSLLPTMSRTYRLLIELMLRKGIKL